MRQGRVNFTENPGDFSRKARLSFSRLGNFYTYVKKTDSQSQRPLFLPASFATFPSISGLLDLRARSRSSGLFSET